MSSAGLPYDPSQTSTPYRGMFGLGLGGGWLQGLGLALSAAGDAANSQRTNPSNYFERNYGLARDVNTRNALMNFQPSGDPTQDYTSLLRATGNPEVAMNAASGAGRLQQQSLETAQAKTALAKSIADANMFRAAQGKPPMSEDEARGRGYPAGLATSVAGATQTQLTGQPPTAQPNAPISASLDGKKFFNEFVAPQEGSKLTTDINGAPVKFGINAKYWPGENVPKMTQDRAGQIFDSAYYNPNLPAPLAAAYGDTAFLAGGKAAQGILQASGGDPAKYLQLRQQYLDSLPVPDNIKAVWSKRTDALGKYIGGLATGAPSPQGGFDINRLGENDPELAMQYIAKQQRPMTAEEQTRYNALPGSTITPMTGEVSRATAYNSNTLISDSTLDSQAAGYNLTGQLPAGVGRSGIAAQKIIDRADTLVPEEIRSQGPQAIADWRVANAAHYVGTKREQATIGQRAGAITVSGNELENLIPLSKTAYAKLPRGQFVPFNRLQSLVANQTSSPEQAAAYTADFGAITAYARALNPQGVPREQDIEKGEQLLSRATSVEAHNAALDQMMKEAGAIRSATQRARGNVPANAQPQGQPSNAPRKVINFSDMK